MVYSTTEQCASYRARAEELRKRAAAETDKACRHTLLHDVELWQRMADYLEKNQRG
jgi:hypothetical protein